MKAPFTFFGGKSYIASQVWDRLGNPKQYIEPFCGSAAMLLSAPKIASLEVVCDYNGFIANFWRAVKHQPDKVAEWADYPVSHIDLGARHKWLMEHRADLEALQDADWPGDAKIAGWWLWGQCAWIGSGWCEWDGKIPHAGSAGMGIQAIGKIPHSGDAGRDHLLTSGGRTAWAWLHKLATRLERVRIVHGDWDRCLNMHYGLAGSGIVAVFLDPPYKGYETEYGTQPVAESVEKWALENGYMEQTDRLRIALCGHVGDYDLPGWSTLRWQRPSNSYGGDKTRDSECIWFSPACINDERQGKLFS